MGLSLPFYLDDEIVLLWSDLENQAGFVVGAKLGGDSIAMIMLNFWSFYIEKKELVGTEELDDDPLVLANKCAVPGFKRC